MKKYKIAFWVSTTAIFLFEGVMTALTSQTQMAKDGITGLGYPLYFGTMLAVFKVVGTIVLMLPMAPKRVKEWAYAGFGIDFIAAFVSLTVVGGFTAVSLFPVIVFAVLVVSYVSYHKMTDAPAMTA
jgi:hypothetical protein